MVWYPLTFLLELHLHMVSRLQPAYGPPILGSNFPTAPLAQTSRWTNWQKWSAKDHLLSSFGPNITLLILFLSGHYLKLRELVVENLFLGPWKQAFDLYKATSSPSDWILSTIWFPPSVQRAKHYQLVIGIAHQLHFTQSVISQYAVIPNIPK